MIIGFIPKVRYMVVSVLQSILILKIMNTGQVKVCVLPPCSLRIKIHHLYLTTVLSPNILKPLC